MIGAAILAAGQGLRFGPPVPKQFETIAGKPVFIYSVELYKSIESVSPLVLVANPQLIDETKELLRIHDCLDGVTVVAGGQTRRDSIRNAINFFTQSAAMQDSDRILLHNAASPNTAPDLVRRCLDVSEDADAVQACMPELRTVFLMHADKVDAVLRRDRHVVSCDPTIYRCGVLREAFDHQAQLDLPGEATTDIVHALGYTIRLVPSVQDNIKITTRWDLAAVTAAMSDVRE